MTLVFVILVALGAPSAAERPCAPPDVRLAQSFKVEGEETKKTPVKPKKKPKPKPKPVKTETDLWSVPGKKAEPKKKADPDDAEVVEIPVEEALDDDPGEEDDEGVDDGAKEKDEVDWGEGGGWGAEVERDDWGDEGRIQKPPEDDQSEPPDVEPGEEDQPAVDKPAEGTGLPVDAGTAAAAEGEEPGPERPAPTQEELAEVAAETGEILPPKGTLADLSAVWARRRIHLEQRDFELARVDLDRLLDLKDELDIRNMRLEANVLVREARQARQAENPEQAQALLEAAIRLAPDLPAVHLAQASLWFSETPLGLGRVFGAVADAARAAFRDPLATNRLLVNLVIGLLLGFGMAAALYLVVQFLRYLRLFVHDFHHLFPRGVARLQTGVVAVVVLLLPILFRAGLVAVLLFWGFVAWLYQETRERVLTILVVAFLAASPLAIDWVVSEMLLEESIVPDLLKVTKGPVGDRQVAVLKSTLEAQPDNHVLLTALGGVYKRTGQLEQAHGYLRRALEVRPTSEVVLNNLGNVRFLQNDLAGAIDLYNRASQVRPDLAVPYYNLSRAYYRKLDLQKGKQSRVQANRLDPDAVSRMAKRAASKRANDVVADLPLPRSWILSQREHLSNGRWKGATGHLWQSWGGTGSAGTFPYVGAGLVVFFGLVLWLRGKLSLASGCVRCGRPACRRCTSELKDDTLCGQCFHAFMHKDQVDAKSRISKEIQIRQYLRRKESIARGITFLLPGIGQIIKDRPLRGMLFLLIFCCVLIQVLLGSGVVRDATSLGAGFDWLKMVPMLIVFLAFYVWAILDVFRVNR